MPSPRHSNRVQAQAGLRNKGKPEPLETRPRPRPRLGLRSTKFRNFGSGRERSTKRQRSPRPQSGRTARQQAKRAPHPAARTLTRFARQRANQSDTMVKLDSLEPYLNRKSICIKEIEGRPSKDELKAVLLKVCPQVGHRRVCRAARGRGGTGASTYGGRCRALHELRDRSGLRSVSA